MGRIWWLFAALCVFFTKGEETTIINTESPDFFTTDVPTETSVDPELETFFSNFSEKYSATKLSDLPVENASISDGFFEKLLTNFSVSISSTEKVLLTEVPETTSMDLTTQGFEVQESVESANETVDEYKIPAETLGKSLDFYNVHLLATHWKEVQKNISATCRDEVDKFIAGVYYADQWAFKSKYFVFICNLCLISSY